MSAERGLSLSRRDFLRLAGAGLTRSVLGELPTPSPTEELGLTREIEESLIGAEERAAGIKEVEPLLPPEEKLGKRHEALIDFLGFFSGLPLYGRNALAGGGVGLVLGGSLAGWLAIKEAGGPVEAVQVGPVPVREGGAPVRMAEEESPIRLIRYQEPVFSTDVRYLDWLDKQMRRGQGRDLGTGVFPTDKYGAIGGRLFARLATATGGGALLVSLGTKGNLRKLNEEDPLALREKIIGQLGEEVYEKLMMAPVAVKDIQEAEEVQKEALVGLEDSQLAKVLSLPPMLTSPKLLPLVGREGEEFNWGAWPKGGRFPFWLEGIKAALAPSGEFIFYELNGWTLIERGGRYEMRPVKALVRASDRYKLGGIANYLAGEQPAFEDLRRAAETLSDPRFAEKEFLVDEVVYLLAGEEDTQTELGTQAAVIGGQNGGEGLKLRVAGRDLESLQLVADGFGGGKAYFVFKKKDGWRSDCRFAVLSTKLEGEEIFDEPTGEVVVVEPELNSPPIGGVIAAGAGIAFLAVLARRKRKAAV